MVANKCLLQPKVTGLGEVREVDCRLTEVASLSMPC